MKAAALDQLRHLDGLRFGGGPGQGAAGRDWCRGGAFGGVGSGAVQGARIAGARHIIAVDPVPFKLEKALEVGATHTVARPTCR